MSPGNYSVKFPELIRLLREGYEARRMASNLYPPAGKMIEELMIDHSKSHDIFCIWYEDEGAGHRHVRLHDLPNTFSGQILRLRRDLPRHPFHIEIYGDSVRTIQDPPNLPAEPTVDDEDCSTSLELLAVVDVDPTKHFTKRAKYNSEVLNYLKLQSDKSLPPDAHSSEYVITLLGRSAQNEMVFPKVKTSQHSFYPIRDLSTYKQWILELISALRFIHSHGIIHKDLRPANVLLIPYESDVDDVTAVAATGERNTESRLRLILCDLESRWGNREAPELDKTSGSDAGWSEKSDIYDINLCIKGMVYGNHPINPIVGAEWEIPAPLDEICKACTVANPAERPTLDQLEALVRAIDTI